MHAGLCLAPGQGNPGRGDSGMSGPGRDAIPFAREDARDGGRDLFPIATQAVIGGS